ncbi:MAG: DUF4383 domain-containing protein [Candidatus Woesearchaeota archaeon]|jgi:hypothetical protein|nr:DUF4383 domain-containing protein [Candidatus Woesearchaeota archaeon]MDP7198505.1 DUF4383 domain-containing protein [Candidatus Woesearchaeota archaeon]MDP7466753.1 DUF4383 domain-containing protein [Candidatus Woesearchaeota archaeon]MDP7647978.1 DUF4383 domain-containing protein [Candidatus Woesearchaeota archaeon]
MSLQKKFATGLGALLLIVGIWGFVAGSVLIFDVNTPHNILHVVTGVLGLVAGLTAGGAQAKTFNVIFGIVYALVTVVGLLNIPSMVNLLNLNAADNILHLVIAVATLGVAFGSHD